jgi:hypothetical protein
MEKSEKARKLRAMKKYGKKVNVWILLLLLKLRELWENRKQSSHPHRCCLFLFHIKTNQYIPPIQSKRWISYLMGLRWCNPQNTSEIACSILAGSVKDTSRRRVFFAISESWATFQVRGSRYPLRKTIW